MGNTYLQASAISNDRDDAPPTLPRLPPPPTMSRNSPIRGYFSIARCVNATAVYVARALLEVRLGRFAPLASVASLPSSSPSPSLRHPHLASLAAPPRKPPDPETPPRGLNTNRATLPKGVPPRMARRTSRGVTARGITRFRTYFREKKYQPRVVSGIHTRAPNTDARCSWRQRNRFPGLT